MATPSDTGSRTRTIQWTDPGAGLERLAGLSGLEAVEAGLRGELPVPPMAQLLGLRGVEAEEGRVVLAVEPAEYHANHVGAVHGALAAGLLDAATSTAVHTTLPRGVYATTAQMSVHFLRPIPMGAGEVRAEARVVHRGKRTAVAEGSVVDPAGKLCARAMATCLLMG